MPAPSSTLNHQRRAFNHLLAAFERAPDWRWLEAAHVLGQSSLPLHWRSHTAMLRYAVRRRDAGEAVGQIMRLALVPLGHLAARLPAGNIGRATVSAFRPMAPVPAVQALIHEALAATVS